MIVNVAIVESDKDNVEMLKTYFEKYTEENKQVYFNISCFSDGIEITSDYTPHYNIIFLGIKMKRQDGISAAHHIRKIDKSVIIIFVAELVQYAVEGYAVDALDFLVKPVQYLTFANALNRSVGKLKKDNDKFVLLPTKAGVIKTEMSEIVYLERYKRNVIVHTTEERYVLTSSLKNFENQLLSNNFFRCNHCYIINLAYVNSLKGNAVLIDKYTLTVSRSRKNAFIEALTGYVGSGAPKQEVPAEAFS